MKEKQTVREPEEESSSTSMEKMEETTSSASKCNKEADEDSESTFPAKKKVKKAEEDTSDSTEEVEKAGYEQNPEEGAAEGKKDSNTLTPGKMTGKPQNVFVPPTNVPGSRIASGNTPSETHYAGKSVDPDFQKSPLYVEMNKQMDNLAVVFSKKLDSVEKSVKDRIDNVLKMMEKIEEFNKKSFNKAYSEEIGQVPLDKAGIEEVMKTGKARFVQ